MKYKIKGFTLIEILTTIAVIAIITMLALPSYHEYRARLESRITTQTLTLHIQKARQDALLYRQNVIICPSSDLVTCHNNWTHGFIAFLDSNHNLLKDDNELILVSSPLNLKYGSLIWQGFSAGKLIFEGSTGQPLRSNGRFTYCSYKHTYHRQLIMGRMGNPRSVDIDHC